MSIKSELAKKLALSPDPRTTITILGEPVEVRRISAADYVAAGSKCRGDQDSFMREIHLLACYEEDKRLFDGDDGWRMLCDYFANYPADAAKSYTEIVAFLQTGPIAEEEAKKN